MNETRPHRDHRWVRRAILAFAVVAPIWTITVIGHDIIWALVPLFFSHLALLYPTLNPHSQWWGPVVRSFATPRKEVWLTIDDGPSAQTESILELLDRFGAKATFFVIGERAVSRASEVDEILRRGHQLANHTFTHPSSYFWCSPPPAIRREISRCSKALPGSGSALFRAPVGIKNFWVHPALQQLGHTCIGWTVRGFDTVLRDPAKVAKRVHARVDPGAIILLHERETRSDRGAFHTACLEAVLQELDRAGYRCVVPTADQYRVNAPANSDTS